MHLLTPARERGRGEGQGSLSENLTFWLGTHEPSWLNTLEIPLMVSARRTARIRTLPRARKPWFRDSGGFTELLLNGGWDRVPVETFVAQARRDAEEIGLLAYASPQDWMCEAQMLMRTGLTVAEHQARTVANYLELMERAPELPWVPVLQGWTAGDYLRHIDDYGRAGVDLWAAPIVGVGTLCRRQATGQAAHILSLLAGLGVALHGFGLKAQGLRQAAGALASADSMAWSYAARREAPLAGCTHKNCANCKHYALEWRERLLAGIGESTPLQLAMQLD